MLFAQLTGLPEEVFEVPGASYSLDDKTLADHIRARAAEFTRAIEQAKQAGLTVDVIWRHDEQPTINIAREY